MNVALVAPAGIWTYGGTLCAAGLELRRVTITLNAGAGPVSVTVPVTAAVDPPTNETGETLTPAKPGGVTVKVVD